MEYDILDLKKAISEKNTELVKAIMKQFNLQVVDGLIKAVDIDNAKYMTSFWNARQQARKILLNSLYGSLLNQSMKFYDKRIGQSVTLTGRSIAKHMNAKINELITGVYDYKGDAIVYADTDSLSNDSRIKTNIGDMTVEQLFDTCGIKWQLGDKEYAADNNLSTISYNPETDEVTFKPFNYVYRHKTSKERWLIETEDGKSVEVTEDHSVMVERGGELVEVKPSELTDNDILITIIEPN